MSIKQSVSIVVAAVIGGVVGAGLVLSEVRAQASSALVANPKVLTANCLDITDGDGSIRCKITAEGGTPICFFYGKSGGPRMRIGLLGAEQNSSPFISLQDSGSNERLGLGVDLENIKEPFSYLRMRNAEGTTRLLAAMQPERGPMVTMNDDYGKPRGGLMMFDGTKGQDAGLLITGKDKSEYASLMVDAAGPVLYLKKEGLNACVGVTKELGSAAMFGRESGSPRMYVGIDGSSKPVVRRFKRSQKSIRQEERIQKLLNDAKKTKEIQVWSDDESKKP